MKTQNLLVLGIYLICFTALSSHGQTYVGGTISQDSVWDVANSPYELTSTLRILNSATLTINEGVVIFLNEHSLACGFWEDYSYGFIEANGASFIGSGAIGLYFYPPSPMSQGSFLNCEFEDVEITVSGKGEFKNCYFSDQTYLLSIYFYGDFDDGGVEAHNPNLIFENNSFENIEYPGIWISGWSGGLDYTFEDYGVPYYLNHEFNVIFDATLIFNNITEFNLLNSQYTTKLVAGYWSYYSGIGSSGNIVANGTSFFGEENGSYEEIRTRNKNSTAVIQNCSLNGVQIYNAQPNCLFSDIIFDNVDFPIRIGLTSQIDLTEQISNVSFADNVNYPGISINGVLMENYTLPNIETPYYINGALGIGNDKTLTISPECIINIIKLGSTESEFKVYDYYYDTPGHLIADNVEFIGLGGFSRIAISNYDPGSSALLTNCIFDSVRVFGSADEFVFENNIITSNPPDWYNNNWSIQINIPEDGSYSIVQNDFCDYGSALDGWDGGSSLLAINNYWGHSSGPYNETLNPDGQGCQVSDNVIFTPWSEVPFNMTSGKVTGVITDTGTGLPIQDAMVYLSGNIMALSPTNQYGEFVIENVPFGYHYSVFAYAGGYDLKEIPQINILPDYPFIEINIDLNTTIGEVEITELTPNPNPEISVTMEDGTLHRYYLLKNNITTLPAPGIEIQVQSSNDPLYFESNKDGIVEIIIESGLIGDGYSGDEESFSIVKIGDDNLSIPIDFICQVIKTEYEKSWNNYNYAKAGVNIMGFDVSLESDRGAITKLILGDGDISSPEFIHVSRQARAGAGIAFNVKAPGVSCNLGSVNAGFGGQAGLGAKFMGLTEDDYLFGYENTNNWEAVAKYILIASSNYKEIDNTMIRFLSVLENNFSNQSTLSESFISDGIGIDVVREVTAEAFAGIQTSELIEVGAGQSIGGEAHVGFKAINHEITNEREFNFGISGRFSGQTDASIKIDFLNNEFLESLEEKIKIWDKDSYRGIQFSVFFDKDNLTNITKFEIKFIRRNNLEETEEIVTYLINGQDAIDAISNLPDNIQEIINANLSGSEIDLGNTSFKTLIEELFAKLVELQSSQIAEIDISYTRELLEFYEKNPFELDLDLSATVLAVTMGGIVGFEVSNSMIVEQGKWILGKHFASQKFNNPIPLISITYDQTLQQIIDDVPFGIRVLIGLIQWLSPSKDNTTYSIGDNGSYIIFPDNAFPSGIDSISCSSWSWYGDSPSKKLSDNSLPKQAIYSNNKIMAEESYGMEYGIGGFYQFEPYGLNLLDTCWITIFYDQEEIINIDESSLGIYWEDKANHQWKFIKSVVDTINNTVTAPVKQLALFTVAPATPWGSFSLFSSPDSIPADGQSTALVSSDTVFNNNITPVIDGELFTVATSLGTITSIDEDSELEGIQISSVAGKIQFNIQSNSLGGIATISANSVKGSANSTTQIEFYDTISPEPPVLLSVTSGDSKAYLFWNENVEEDIAGYVIYYDTDTLLPFEGIHTIIGEPSPIVTGKDTTKNLFGLFNDTTYYFSITAYDLSGNESEYSNFISATPKESLTVDLKVMLEGPYNGNTMDSLLFIKGQIPYTQPFIYAPWYYLGDENGANFQGVFVDWVLVELRETNGGPSSATSNAKIASQAAFLLKNGDIVNRSGKPLEFNVAVSQDLYIVILHRNHLGIMSANPVTESEGIYSCDFTTSESQTFGGSNSVNEISSGIWGMIAADGNSDNSVDNLDNNNIWKNEVGESGYKSGDYNLEGEVNNIDKNEYWLPNIGKGSQVPD